jgi:glycosyltransferase involved in cell wall biosynthesis
MLISIIIPTLNRLEYLKKTLLSVKAQTNKNYEIIVIDNASNDGTREWLETQDDLVIIRQEEILPVYKNWTTGFRKATGDLFRFYCLTMICWPLTVLKKYRLCLIH